MLLLQSLQIQISSKNMIYDICVYFKPGSLCFSLVPIAAVLPQTKAKGIRIYVCALQNAEQAAAPSTVGAQAIEAGNHLGGSSNHSVPKSGEKRKWMENLKGFCQGGKVHVFSSRQMLLENRREHDKQPTGQQFHVTCHHFSMQNCKMLALVNNSLNLSPCQYSNSGYLLNNPYL